jgi:PIN domain nuclease of toxin-antitoxin system
LRLLLDTQALLWYLLDDRRLSAAARSAIVAEENEILISPASLWETAIKISLGRYSLDRDLDDFFDQHLTANHFSVLAITTKHAASVVGLPFHHRDPFDRLLVSQAICEQVPIVSSDVMFDRYPVNRIW